MLFLLCVYLNWTPWPAPAPTAADLAPFPPQWLAEHQIAFLEQRRVWLAGQRGLYADRLYAPWFDAAEGDNAARLRTWQDLQAAQWLAERPYAESTVIVTPAPMPNITLNLRGFLADLKQRLGPDAYREGRMPLPVAARFTTPLP